MIREKIQIEIYRFNFVVESKIFFYRVFRDFFFLIPTKFSIIHFRTSQGEIIRTEKNSKKDDLKQNSRRTQVCFQHPYHVARSTGNVENEIPWSYPNSRRRDCCVGTCALMLFPCVTLKVHSHYRCLFYN